MCVPLAEPFQPRSQARCQSSGQCCNFAGRALVLRGGALAAERRLSDSVGGALGAPHARAALPLVHLLVPAPELHPRALQHAPLPRHRRPGALQPLAV